MHGAARDLPYELPAWLRALTPAPHPETGDPDFVPGFGFVQPVAVDALHGIAARMLSTHALPRLAFLRQHHARLAEHAGFPNVAGLCALIFLDRKLSHDDAERTFLMLRLEPALAAAQRARAAGLAAFPSFQDRHVYEGSWPAPHAAPDYAIMKKEVGLE